jgi:hypothetical protein
MGALSDLDDFIHPYIPYITPPPTPTPLTRLTHNIHNNINNTPHPPLPTTFHTHAGGVGSGFSSDGVYEPVCEGVCDSCLGSLGLVCCVGGFGGFEWGVAGEVVGLWFQLEEEEEGRGGNRDRGAEGGDGHLNLYVRSLLV